MPILQNSKHEKFAQELAKSKSQGAAYVAAGYAANESHASRLARNGKVAARVSELMAAGAERAEIDISMVLQELGKIGFANMQDYIGVTTDGDAFVTLAGMTRDQAAAVSQITVEDFKDGRGEDSRDVRKITFRLFDKRAALVDIGRHLGMFEDIVKHKGEITLVPIVNVRGKSKSG